MKTYCFYKKKPKHQGICWEEYKRFKTLRAAKKYASEKKYQYFEEVFIKDSERWCQSYEINK